MKKILLNNGEFIPNIGFGTFKISREEASTAVSNAIMIGYRHFDCAAAYKNEKEVGAGIKQGLALSGLKRSDLFITSKLWNGVRGYDETLKAFNQTLNDLGLDYLDLYLIHWPVPNKYHQNYRLKNAESWRAMEKLVEDGKIRSIGVSNFKIHHLEELKQSSTLPISVNQIQFHPNCTQNDLVKYCIENEIAIEGYATLGQGDAFKSHDLISMAKKYNTTVAKVCTEFSIQSGIIPLLKSTSPERMKDNLEVDFIISNSDMKKLEKVDFVKTLLRDSDNIEF